MSIHSDRNPASRRLVLDALSARVREARTAVHRQRHGPVVPTELASSRRRLVTALEEYTIALDERHLPVPSTLRAELKMHSRLLGG
jgi:hypothetical protein